MISSSRRLMHLILAVSVAAILVSAIGLWMGGFQWRNKALTVHNDTSEVIAVMRFRSGDAATSSRTVVDPGETVTVEFARGNGFMVGGVINEDFGYLEFDASESLYLSPTSDASITVDLDEDGVLRFTTSPGSVTPPVK